jgi:alkylhydroperoxidase/carboxymuconolactone decarboxylase family protein YurZ
MKDARRMGEWSGDRGWVDELYGVAPKFAEGLARVGDVVHTNGALPAWTKALFVAAIGAVKLNPPITERYLGRALDGGLTPAQARGAAITILISRGLPAYGVFTEALRDKIPPAPARDPLFDEAKIDEMLDYLRSVFGQVPPTAQLLADESIRAFEGYVLMRQASLNENELESLWGELMLVAINSAEYEPEFVAVHARGARVAGATEAQLVEAAVCAILIAGMAAWLPGGQGIAMSREVG